MPKRQTMTRSSERANPVFTASPRSGRLIHALIVTWLVSSYPSLLVVMIPFDFGNGGSVAGNVLYSATKSAGGIMVGLVVMGFATFCVVGPIAALARHVGYATRRAAFIAGGILGGASTALFYRGQGESDTPIGLLLKGFGCEFSIERITASNGFSNRSVIEPACRSGYTFGSYTFDAVPGLLLGVLMAAVFWRAYSGHWTAAPRVE